MVSFVYTMNIHRILLVLGQLCYVVGLGMSPEKRDIRNASWPANCGGTDTNPQELWEWRLAAGCTQETRLQSPLKTLKWEPLSGVLPSETASGLLSLSFWRSPCLISHPPASNSLPSIYGHRVHLLYSSHLHTKREPGQLNLQDLGDTVPLGFWNANGYCWAKIPGEFCLLLDCNLPSPSPTPQDTCE